jgi:hypothetical protein
MVRGPWLACGFLIASFATAQDSNNRLAPEEKKEGWQLLFDGKTLTGWDARTTFAAPATGDWSVENGAIVCPGKTPGWLSTAAAFSDFRLKLQFRGAANVNSGVFLRSQKEGAPHVTGYELQIWDFQPAGYNTGSLVGTVKAPPTKIIGDQWNDYDIRAEGDHFFVVLNGNKVLDAHDAAHREGVLGFQCQVGYRIEFRNIRVLPARH